MRKSFLLIITIFLITNVSIAQVPTNGLVAYYPFNGNANDESGNGNNGTVNGATLTTDRFGNENSAYSFDGNSKITASASALPTGSSARTISIWVKSSNMAVGNKMLIAWGNATDHQMSALGVGHARQPSRKAFFWGYGQDVINTTVMNDNQWYMITFTFDGSVGKVYTNGNFENSSELILNTPENTILNIGYWEDITMNPFTGEIDDVLIYDRVLSESEIGELYGNYSPYPNIDIRISAPKNYSDFYHLENFQQDKIWLEVTLEFKGVSSPTFSNLKFEAILDDTAMDLHLNSTKMILDPDSNGVIKNFPKLLINNKIEFLVSSKTLTNNIEDKNLILRIKEIDGISTDITMNEIISYYYAKQNTTNKPFDLSVDAYKFENLGELTFYELTDFLTQRKLITQLGPIMYLYSLMKAFGGRCEGMASTTGSYFIDPNTKPLPGNVRTWDSTNVRVTENINVAHVRQVLYNSQVIRDYEDVYNEIKTNLKNGLPILMGYGVTGYNGKHVNLGTALTELKSNKKSFVTLYENENPNETWYCNFDLSSKKIEYREVYDKINVVPPRIYHNMNSWEFYVTAWRNNLASYLINSAQKLIGTACPVNLMVIDENGKRAGYNYDGEYINEINGAIIQRYEDGKSDSLTLIFVPKTGNYEIEINGYADGLMRFEFAAPTNENEISFGFIDSVKVNPNFKASTSKLNSLNFMFVDNNGDGIIDDSLAVNKNSIITSVKSNEYEEVIIPKNFSLSQNYPNPFNPSTTIKYTIPKQSKVTLKVFDVLGSELATLINKEQPQGNYEVEFDGKDLTSGIYFYKLKAGDFIETKKMILLK